MIEFNDIFCLDLKDDYEWLGMSNKDFTLFDLTNYDLSKGFAFGYCVDEWNDLWMPISIRKELRHIGDHIKDFPEQVLYFSNLYQQEYGNDLIPSVYADFMLSHFLYEDDKLFYASVLLGRGLKKTIKNLQKV